MYVEVVCSVLYVHHLAITQTYMALPKGGMVPDHVLILPIGHYAASTDAPEVCNTV